MYICVHECACLSVCLSVLRMCCVLYNTMTYIVHLYMHDEISVHVHVAHELRAWLLHYCPIVLHGVLHSDYYQHHLLLIEGVYLLLKQVVSQEDIEQSFRLLKHYCFMFSILYGKMFMCPLLCVLVNAIVGVH